MSCAAYVSGGGQRTVAGKRRHRKCKRDVTTERTRTEATVAYTTERTYALCGQHAAQWDKAERGEGFPPNLSSDW